jgi:hypothetical protein
VKVTLKNTRILFYLSVANVLVCALIFFFSYSGFTGILTDLLLAEYCLTFILTLFYFIRILLYFKEATAVFAAYSMFTCLLAISFILIAFPRLLSEAYSTWLSTLTEVVCLLAAFRSFFVKAAAVRLPFRLFGAGLGLVVLPRILMLLIATHLNEDIISTTSNLGLLVILFSTVFIFKRMMDFQKTEVQPSPTEEQETSLLS